MRVLSEIDVFIQEIRENCPEIVVSQLNSFREKPFESGVWKFWHPKNCDVYVSMKVQNGLCWAIYSNKEFEDKYPFDSSKICAFLNGFRKLDEIKK